MRTREVIVRRWWAWLLLFVAAFLLISFGGAIVAAPLSVPFLVWAARASSSKSYRIGAGIVVVLTMAEVVWALTYLAIGEAKPAIWLVPTLAMFGVIFAYTRLSRPPAI